MDAAENISVTDAPELRVRLLRASRERLWFCSDDGERWLCFGACGLDVDWPGLVAGVHAELHRDFYLPLLEQAGLPWPACSFDAAQLQIELINQLVRARARKEPSMSSSTEPTIVRSREEIQFVLGDADAGIHRAEADEVVRAYSSGVKDLYLWLVGYTDAAPKAL